MTRQEGNRFRSIERSIEALRCINNSDMLRQYVKDKNSHLINVYVNELVLVLQKECSKQKKQIGHD
jgi:hypothetical protein